MRTLIRFHMSAILVLLSFAPLCAISFTFAPSEAHAQMGPGGGFGQQRPGGRRPRLPKPPEPISVEKYDKAVARQHKDADTDRDGFLTVAEVREAVSTLADEAIRKRFKGIDSDGDGTIAYSEFAAWQTNMGSQALSDRSAMGARREMVPSALPFDPGKGAEARLFSRLIKPLDPAMIARADGNYDGKVSVEELQYYQRKSFAAIDSNSDTFIDFTEIQKAAPGGARRAGGPGPPTEESEDPVFAPPAEAAQSGGQ